jgi:hypothetical protein
MHEPACTLTDYALTIECGVLSVLLIAGPSRIDSACRSGAAFFASIAICSLAGGTLHGFVVDSSSLSHKILWSTTLISIGCAATSAWATAAQLLLSSRAAKWVTVAAVIELAAYIPAVLLLGGKFIFAIINYLPAMAFLLAAAFAAAFRTRSKSAIVGAGGILLAFAASYAQANGIALHAHYFDHNALYHLIQGVGLFMIFYWLSRRTGVVSRSDARGKAAGS